MLGSEGLFLDMSVHDLDLARFLVREVEQVCAWASVLIDDKFAQANDADAAGTLLQFKNGGLGVMETLAALQWGIRHSHRSGRFVRQSRDRGASENAVTHAVNHASYKSFPRASIALSPKLRLADQRRFLSL